jgi:acetyl esterase/lipase
MFRCIVSSLIVVFVVVASSSAREPDAVLPLWPDKPPGEAAELPPEADTTKEDGKLIAGKRLIRLGNVSQPTLSVFLPPADKRNGAAIVICPGGGYNILAFDLEGTEVAEWFNERGITCFVLKYRVPRRSGQEPKQLAALQDGQRAMGLVRSRASEWNVDPARIGILGFSAGGNLAAMTSMHFDQRRYEAVDAADAVSSRPDFSVLVYPAYLVEGDKLHPDVEITKQTPPTFLVHASDDGVTPVNSALYYVGLKQAGVPSELHIYSKGGHGYGLRPTELPVTAWPQRCNEWLTTSGWLKK